MRLFIYCLDLLVEDHTRNLPFDRSRRNELSQLAAFRIPLDDSHHPIALQPDGQERVFRVHAELTGEPATGRHLLNRRQGSSGRVNGEVDQGIRDDGSAVVGVEVGDLEGVLVARGDNEEVLVVLPNS